MVSELGVISVDDLVGVVRAMTESSPEITSRDVRAFGRTFTWRPIEYGDDDKVCEYELKPIRSGPMEITGEARRVLESTHPETRVWRVRLNVRHVKDEKDEQVKTKVFASWRDTDSSLVEVTIRVATLLRKHISDLSVALAGFVTEQDEPNT